VIASAWINEVKWLDITITPSYVRVSQCNGVGSGLCGLHRFMLLAAARAIIGELIVRYNTQWLIERLGCRTPAAARAAAMEAWRCARPKRDRTVPSGSTIVVRVIL